MMLLPSAVADSSTLRAYLRDSVVFLGGSGCRGLVIVASEVGY